MRRFRAQALSPIPRVLPTDGIARWRSDAPRLAHVDEQVRRVIACAPAGWRAAIERRFAHLPPPVVQAGMSAASVLAQPPAWARAWDLLQVVADFEDEFGDAGLWNLTDGDIRELAARLADDVACRDERMTHHGMSLVERLDDVRRFIRRVGVHEDKPIDGEPAIARAKDAKWWRRRLRTHVARTVEAGAVRLHLVHKGRGGYVSTDGLKRRRAQLARNAEALKGSLLRNEAGQVWRLDELAALGTANPLIRGGELMTRIRGAEVYADARAHVGLFLTLTLPSRFHAMRQGSGGRTVPNPRYGGATPREGQLWLRGMWQKTRAALARRDVRMYGLRVAEPHHDATPHWHMLVWAEDEAGARAIEERVRYYWLSDAGDERGAAANRVDVKRMLRGGAAGYVAKYIAKSVGHVALAEHLDVADGQQIAMDLGPWEPGDAREPAPQQPETIGHQRVDAWASTWGLRQFQTFGMPSVTVWRELRRVTPDQLELFQREGDRQTVRAHQACHRHGGLRADWCLFMEAMGGHAVRREHWHLRCARRHVEPGQCDRYGEPVKVGRVVGLTPQRGRLCGRWLVSRRIGWRPLTGEPGAKAEAALRPALPAAWTRFNNCTARLDDTLRRQLLNGGRPWKPLHDSDWIEPPHPDPALQQPTAPPHHAVPVPGTTWVVPRHVRIATDAPSPNPFAALTARLLAHARLPAAGRD